MNIGNISLSKLKPYGIKFTKNDIKIILEDKDFLNKMYIAMNITFNKYNNIILDDIDLNIKYSLEWLKENM